MTSSTKSFYAGHRFPPDLISYTVWLYFRKRSVVALDQALTVGFQL